MPPDRIRSFVLILGILVPTSPLLAADGDLDTSFSADGKATLAWGFTAEAAAVAPLDDGSLLVGGSAKPASTAPWDFAVAKYLADGTLDTDWGVSGKRSVTGTHAGPTEERLLEIVATPSGSAVLLGTTAAQGQKSFRRPFLARLTAGGDLDPTFGDGGTAVGDDSPYLINTFSATRHLNGYLFFGWCDCSQMGWGGLFLYRTGPLGQPDTQFGEDGWRAFETDFGDPFYPEAVAVQPDGKIVVAWVPYAGTVGLWRFLPDGTPDPDFGSAGRTQHFVPGLYSKPTDLAFDANSGAIYVTFGQFSPGEAPIGTVARLEVDGDLDTSFGFPDLTLEEGSDITTLAVTTDGKIVAAGRIDANGDQPGGFFLARLLPSGAFDDSFDDNGLKRVEFDLATNGVDAARGLALSGGKPVVVGYATQAGTEPATSFAILRLANTHIFGDGLEVGSTWQWSQVVQPAP